MMLETMQSLYHPRRDDQLGYVLFNPFAICDLNSVCKSIYDFQHRLTRITDIHTNFTDYRIVSLYEVIDVIALLNQIENSYEEGNKHQYS